MSQKDIVRRFLHIAPAATRRETPRKRPPTGGRLPYGLLEEAPFPVWVSTTRGVLRFLNLAFRGVAPELRAFSADALWRSMVHPEDLQNWTDTLASAAAARESFKIELRILGPDSGVRWFLVNAEPLRIKNRLQGYWGTALDITAQKRQDRSSRTSEDRFRLLADITRTPQADEQLRLSECRYRSFFEQSIEGIWRLALRAPLATALPIDVQVDEILQSAYVAECNDAMALMSGYTQREQLIGASLVTFLDPENADHRQFLRSFVQGGYRVDRTETREIDRSGSPRYFLNTMVGTVMDGALREAWGSRSEITQRRMADREMRLLAQTITSAKDCISITDLHDSILFVNEAFLTTYGYEEEELIGRNISIVRSTRNPDVQVGEILQRSLEGGWNGEIINRRKNGSEFPIELWTSVVRNEEGNPVAVVGAARDITERHRKDEQIKASLHEKEVLLKEIHHRVKNNLQVISSLLSLQSEYIQDPEMLRFFRESQNRVRSMALIHEKLYQSSNLARVDFDGYIRELTGQLFRSYVPGGRAVALQLDAQPVSLGIDKAIPCGIILNELVTNALKYAFPGEQRGSVYVGCSAAENGTVQLVVGDDGVGLPLGFEMGTTDTLGLKLVNMLCDQLQATLGVSRRGVHLGAQSGVEFMVTFAGSNAAVRPGATGGLRA